MNLRSLFSIVIVMLIWSVTFGPPAEAGTKNIAREGTARQSSTFADAEASRAIDGNTDGNYNDGSVTHTNQDAEAWWEVDLGYQAIILSIVVWNRTDCCSGRLNGAKLHILDAERKEMAKEEISVTGSPNYTFSYESAPKKGRYVRITLANQFLSLAEVQVFSRSGDDGRPVTLEDLTQNGPEIATEFSGDPTQHDQLANFAWREFIAMCTPADTLPQNRGKPDPNRNFVDSGKPDFYASGKADWRIGTNLLVWETFAHRSELFPHNWDGTGPVIQPFAKNPSYVFKGAEGGGVPPVFPNGVFQLYNNLDENSQIGQNHLFFPTNPPTPAENPDDDAQVLFEAKVNQIEYDYGQPLTASANVSMPYSSVEVKAAWRPVTEDIDPSRYHVADVVYYTGSDKEPVAQNGQYALIGLHIIQKTQNYPTFIFATFEHIDSLTTPAGEPTGLYYIPTYEKLKYDRDTGPLPSATVRNESGADIPAINIPLPATGEVPERTTVFQPPGTITTAVERVNKNVLGLMNQSSDFDNSVWKYYKLKGVQAIPTSSEGTLDFYLANIVVESSQPGIQLFKGGVTSVENGVFTNNRNEINLTAGTENPFITPGQHNVGGCMGCHGVAQVFGQDFSFLFFSKAGVGFVADTKGIPAEEDVRARQAKYGALFQKK